MLRRCCPEPMPRERQSTGARGSDDRGSSGCARRSRQTGSSGSAVTGAARASPTARAAAPLTTADTRTRSSRGPRTRRSCALARTRSAGARLAGLECTPILAPRLARLDAASKPRARHPLRARPARRAVTSTCRKLGRDQPARRPRSPATAPARAKRPSRLGAPFVAHRRHSRLGHAASTARDQPPRALVDFLDATASASTTSTGSPSTKSVSRNGSGFQRRSQDVGRHACRSRPHLRPTTPARSREPDGFIRTCSRILGRPRRLPDATPTRADSLPQLPRLLLTRRPHRPVAARHAAHAVDSRSVG